MYIMLLPTIILILIKTIITMKFLINLIYFLPV
ncbi:unnamed protein product [Schistosoma margrebowiei]|uniref:Uncharacterized protein n=1 Tax=Schistosoma margrebowiei TaxID=48269 RepID=A0A3P8BW98_9TREM|nr:unnamed protein product [Schistosoma margrebowiei]